VGHFGAGVDQRIWTGERARYAKMARDTPA
jgi:hypothetical protein